MKHERGNILFLILLAVILFAALSYAVTQSLRGGGNDASPEKAKAMAAQALNYGTLLENTMMRMRVSGKYPEWGYDFDDGAGPSISSANATCTETGCRMFTTSARQGQIPSVQFDEKFVDPRARLANPGWGGGSGSYIYIAIMRVLDIGTDLPDVVMLLMNLPPAICQAINEGLGFTTTGDEGTYGSFGIYDGTLTSLPAAPGAGAIIGDDNPVFRGRAAGCTPREGSGYGGIYYHVIMAR